jgi:hypothetical protein
VTSICECGGKGERAPRRRGVWTSHTFKRCATNDFRNSLKEGRIRLAKHCFSAEGREFRKDAVAQLKRWTLFTEQPRTSEGSERSWISGKGRNGNMSDDLAMALIINHAVSRLLMGVCGQKYNVAQFAQNGLLQDD